MSYQPFIQVPLRITSSDDMSLRWSVLQTFVVWMATIVLPNSRECCSALAASTNLVFADKQKRKDHYCYTILSESCLGSGAAIMAENKMDVVKIKF